jgi:hypothetical protein
LPLLGLVMAFSSATLDPDGSPLHVDWSDLAA